MSLKAKNSIFLLFSLLLSLQVALIRADLPVHCLKHQIVGAWSLHLTDPVTSDPDERVTCEHDSPDSPRTSYLAMQESFDSSKDMNLHLNQDDSIKEDGVLTSGSMWTMIYDEGFEIRHKGVRYFTFSQYVETSSGFKSKCSETLVGWYHNYNNNEKGCFKAEKVGATSELTQNVKQAYVVEPDYVQVKEKESAKKKVPHREEEKKKDSKEGKFLRTLRRKAERKNEDVLDKTPHSKRSETQHKTHEERINFHEDRLDKTPHSKRSENQHKTHDEPITFHEDHLDKTPHSKRSETQHKKQDEPINFRQFDAHQHQKVSERLNKNVKKKWVAGVHKQFEGLTLSELNGKAGRKKKGISSQEFSFHPFSSFIQEKGSNYHVDVSDLPKSLDWYEYIKAPRSQGDCGSCYVFATLAMLQARLKIHYSEDVVLSVQHSINCNYYNQGCDGGYPFLVEKYANEYGLVDDKCAPYQASNGRCEEVCDPTSLEKTYHVKDYRFVGGSYGRTNEREMMLEIQKNGPIVVSFEPSYDFMYYQSGIYHSVSETDWIKNGEEKPEWEKVDHSVLCYGWGEEDGEKYWMLQNTWGSDWGERGLFRMRRGTDESHIESLAEAADPMIKKRNGNVFKQSKNRLFSD